MAFETGATSQNPEVSDARDAELPINVTTRRGTACWHVSKMAMHHELNRGSLLGSTKAAPLRNGRATFHNAFSHLHGCTESLRVVAPALGTGLQRHAQLHATYDLVGGAMIAAGVNDVLKIRLNVPAVIDIK